MPQELGFGVGKSSPCLFRNEERNLRPAIHGDDIAAVGDDARLAWFEGASGPQLGVNVRARFGPGRKTQGASGT